jgi:hypothetical protein
MPFTRWVCQSWWPALQPSTPKIRIKRIPGTSLVRPHLAPVISAMAHSAALRITSLGRREGEGGGHCSYRCRLLLSAEVTVTSDTLLV